MAKKNLTKLVKKRVSDKNGNTRTVWVKRDTTTKKKRSKQTSESTGKKYKTSSRWEVMMEILPKHGVKSYKTDTQGTREYITDLTSKSKTRNKVVGYFDKSKGILMVYDKAQAEKKEKYDKQLRKGYHVISEKTVKNFSYDKIKKQFTKDFIDNNRIVTIALNTSMGEIRVTAEQQAFKDMVYVYVEKGKKGKRENKSFASTTPMGAMSIFERMTEKAAEISKDKKAVYYIEGVNK